MATCAGYAMKSDASERGPALHQQLINHQFNIDGRGGDRYGTGVVCRIAAKPDALPTQTAAGAYITGVVSYHAGLRRVDGVGYQTQLAPGGHVILDFDWHPRHRGADPLALHS